MKYKISEAFLLVVIVFLCSSLTCDAATIHVCQDCQSYPQYTSIDSAISNASSGDVINVWAEGDGGVPEAIYKYNEHLVINKEITLTCDNPHATLGYPVIWTGFTTYNEVIKVTESDVEISNLIIQGPNSDSVSHSYAIDQKENKVGIRIEAGDCVVDNCTITKCMTGIVIDSSDDVSDTGNRISNCQIGDRYVYQNYSTEEYW